MTPKEYLDRYTYMKFFSPWNFAQVSTPITNYGAGAGRHGDCATGAQVETERGLFTAALRMAHHGNANHPCGEVFRFPKAMGTIPPTEEFYSKSFFRAFLGKGSPDEIIDTLRVAMAIGRIGQNTDKDYAGQRPARSTVQAYAKDFMTLDCNGLVGNYHGVNSDGHISQFAVPARRRTRIQDVQVGDCFVTHCAKAPYEHVGLIAEWTPVGDDSASVRIAEWGWYGGEDAHYTKSAKHKIVQGPEKTFGIGFEAEGHMTVTNADNTKTRVKTPSFRYVFAPPGPGGPLGWY